MEINLLDRDRFAESIPHEWFTWLREHDPVHFHEEPDGPGFWVVSRHADIVAVNRDAASYSSDALRGGVVVIEEEMAEREAVERKPHQDERGGKQRIGQHVRSLPRRPARSVRQRRRAVRS